MAKTNNDSSPTTLIIDNQTFKADIKNRIEEGNAILNRPLETLIKEFSDWSDYNDEYLKNVFDKTTNEYRSSYEGAGHGLMGTLSDHPYGSIQERREMLSYKIDNLSKLLKKADLLKSSLKQAATPNLEVKSVNKRDVFIVHGHDDTAKTKTARFIEKLGLNAIILHEQASGGKTIIEKIAEYSNVGFGVVLYTPCDVGGKEEGNLKSRARQNVVFEHGYLIGKIGRNNVCALVKGDVELPNDISGVVYVTMDDNDGWHYKLAKEMRNSGYAIDMNNL